MSDASEERVILITGSSSGLGAALIENFAKKGFGVVINYIIEDQAQAFYDKLAKEIDESKLMKYKANVADRQQVKAMFDEVIEKFGRIDILVNTAGINRDAPFLELTDANWDAVLSAHLKGHFVCGQEYAFHNPSREGAIINVGAACGIGGRENGANFCSAKGGILALTKCMARELAPRIRVNCLVPGSVKTREVIDRYNLDSKEGLDKELASLPMGRLGEFEDIIKMVECMIDAQFTTGANFFANGGQFMH
jgi:NAD(P)-dependent dehydrogenase (short-subunit alcohol dehydrogenase family)